jgi:hypothetical protein
MGKFHLALAGAVLLCLLPACIPPKSHVGPEEKAIPKEFPQLPLPYNIQLNGAADPVQYRTMPADTPYFPVGAGLIGWYPSSHAVAVVYCLPGGDYPIPAIRTFRFGKQVADEQVGVGACGSGDCGFSCEEWLRVAANGSFECRAEIVEWKCDDAGAQIPGSQTQYARTTAGLVDRDGELRMSALDEKR